MELVVAEKPSVARDLARVLGVRPSGKDAFEGTDYVITWCIGHLVELEEPAAYDPVWKSWRLDALPMVPAPFKLRPSPHAVQHLRAVRALLRDRRFAGVIDACDAGREGELIFRYVYQYAGSRLPARRLWISSMTDEAIRRGFATLRPSAQLDPLADAARSRSEADWLVGMNATRAVTVRNRAGGHTSLYSIGRVQTPTLAMIVAREHAIRAFVPRDYWEVRAQLVTAEGAGFAAAWRHGDAARLASAALADEIMARDRPEQPVVETVKAKTVREPPPLLFDLTSLQRTANRRFGFTATRTLELAQALYERHKVLTYPRTDSRHLSNDLAATLPELFRSLAAVPDYAPFAEPLLATPPRPSRRVFDDAKVHDHHAIIPTGAAVRLEMLDRDEHRLFDLVARRFLGAFHGDAEFAVTEAWIRVGPPSAAPAAPATPGQTILEALPPPPDRYLARGRVRLNAGWQAVAGIEDRSEGKDKDDEPAALLPPLVEGQLLEGTYASRAKQTTPPPRYTEATLLGAMESAGKTIDDEALRAAMKDSGLGTPATRASIIETLLKRGFIERDRQNLFPTETGTGLIQALPVASLASPELTGTWEARLSRIARGEDTRAAFMADIARYVTELVDAIRTSTPGPPPANQPESAFGRGGGGGRGKSRSKKPRRGTSSGRNHGGDRTPTPSYTGSPAATHAVGPVRSYPGRDDRAPTSNANPASQPGRDDRASAASSVDGPSMSQPRSQWSTPFDRSPVTSQPTTSRIDVHQDASIIAALRATSRPDSRPDARISVEQRSTPAHEQRPSSAPVAKPKPRRANKPKPALSELGCPRCRAGTLLTGSRGWGCSRWREGCRFVIWFELEGKRLTDRQLRELVARGRTRIAKRGVVLDSNAATAVRYET